VDRTSSLRRNLSGGGGKSMKVAEEVFHARLQHRDVN
jgi:hypothetical protein